MIKTQHFACDRGNCDDYAHSNLNRRRLADIDVLVLQRDLWDSSCDYLFCVVHFVCNVHPYGTQDGARRLHAVIFANIHVDCVVQNMFIMIICDAMDEMNDSDEFNVANEHIVKQFRKLWIERHVTGNNLDHRWLELRETQPEEDAGAASSIDSDDKRGLSSFLS